MLLLGCQKLGHDECPGMGYSRNVKIYGLLLIIVAFWTGCGGSAPTSGAAAQIESNYTKTGVQLSTQENEFLNMLNALRTESGLNPLTLDPTLFTAAAHHSSYMSSKAVLTHAEPKPNTTSAVRIANLGGLFSYSGENVAVGSATGSELFDQWYQSPGHREIMMSEKYQFIGISGKGKYWTADFGGN